MLGRVFAVSAGFGGFELGAFSRIRGYKVVTGVRDIPKWEKDAVRTGPSIRHCRMQLI